MNILADEGVDAPVVARLRKSGHDVLYVAEMEPSINDDLVLNRANDQHALLLTADKDFGELVFRLKRIHGGVVLIRFAGLSLITKANILDTAFTTFGQMFLNAFSVITPGSVRIRPRDFSQ